MHDPSYHVLSLHIHLGRIANGNGLHNIIPDGPMDCPDAV
jgi:hypothetical protein